LGFSLAKVHEESCQLEHVVSEEFIQRIDEILGHPQYSPLGNPIPTVNGDIPPSSSLPLTNGELNTNYLISRISDDNKEMVAYFEEMGFLPGCELKLLSKAPFNGPLSIEHKGNEIVIGSEIGRNIYVDPK
jgi:DtxR family Mn-dependent transcriptional regulator